MGIEFSKTRNLEGLDKSKLEKLNQQKEKDEEYKSPVEMKLDLIKNVSPEQLKYMMNKNLRYRESTILVEAAKNPIIIKESSLSKDIKIENKSNLDDKDVDRILNKHYKNIIKETEKYIDKQYDLMYDKNNPAPIPLKKCKKLIPESIYRIDVKTVNTPKYGDLICFEIWIDLHNAFSGHLINCDYYISADNYKYIDSEFSMNG